MSKICKYMKNKPLTPTLYGLGKEHLFFLSLKVAQLKVKYISTTLSMYKMDTWSISTALSLFKPFFFFKLLGIHKR